MEQIERDLRSNRGPRVERGSPTQAATWGPRQPTATGDTMAWTAEQTEWRMREEARLLRDSVERTQHGFAWTCPCCSAGDEAPTGIIAHRLLRVHYRTCDGGLV